MDAAGKRALLHVQLAALERDEALSEDGTAAEAGKLAPSANGGSGHRPANGLPGFPTLQHGMAAPAEGSPAACVLLPTALCPVPPNVYGPADI